MPKYFNPTELDEYFSKLEKEIPEEDKKAWEEAKEEIWKRLEVLNETAKSEREKDAIFEAYFLGKEYKRNDLGPFLRMQHYSSRRDLARQQGPKKAGETQGKGAAVNDPWIANRFSEIEKGKIKSNEKYFKKDIYDQVSDEYFELKKIIISHKLIRRSLKKFNK